jgi:hypothetical protein
LAILIHREQCHGDLEYGVGLTVETAGFDIHYDRQEPAESVAHCRAGCGREGLVVIGTCCVRGISHRR